MKFRWEQGEIQLEDVVHTLILIDESHRWVNAKKAFALDILGQYLREGPKYFTGSGLPASLSGTIRRRGVPAMKSTS